VEPFFDFLGGYWWLAFPLFGVLAGAGRAWERAARQRHKRRLEVLHAKAEIKAAQAAGRVGTRRGIGAAQAPPPAPASAEADPQRAQLERLFATHDAVTSRWLEYELDVAKLIAFPAMSDGRQPLTASFLRAKRVADGLRPASVKAKLTKEQFDEYRTAVTDFDVAFDLAERDARRLKDSGFSEVERKRLDTAKQLLTIAIDQAATPAERQVAYKRVRQELDGLISLSNEAIVVLEDKVALELTTGPESQQTRPSPRASAPAPGPARSAPADPDKPWPIPSRNAAPGGPSIGPPAGA